MSQKVAIVGYGIEGQSAYRYFKAQDDDVTIFHKERPRDLPEEVKVVTERRSDFEGYDVVVRSPAVRPDRIQTDGRLTSVVKEFFRVFDPRRIIGVTGSKGKGTTASLIHEILKASGMQTHLAGNIGTSVLDLLPRLSENDYVVLELSSFQLWDLDVSPHIAVLLMMEPDHLDVHTDIDEYIAAKANIASHQAADDILVYLPTNDMTMRAVNESTGRRIPYTRAPGAHVQDGIIVIAGQKVVAIKELGLLGPHNVDNACAAVTAAWQITQDVEAMHKALVSFKGLPHRLQFVAEVGGVRYYDDSIATTPGSAIAALGAFIQPKVLILGGSDKGVDFTDLAEEIAQLHDGIRVVILIGQMARTIQTALNEARVDESKVYTFLDTPSMNEVVSKASEYAWSGDAVVMSPACASFDMFRDYKDRGEQYILAVHTLSEKHVL